jgi:vancomycin resistance protein VanW
MDIYTNENRFTPLGSDATVVYGYKDLKIRNNLNHPIKFTFLMEENHITIQLNHSSLIENNKVDFKENILDDNRIEVVTIINQEKKGKSIYKRYVPNTIKK